MVSASFRRAAGTGDRVVVELVRQLLVIAELLNQPVMNRAQALHAIVKPGQIAAGAGDFVAQLVEQSRGLLLGGHGHEPHVLPPPRRSESDVTIAA